MLEMKRHFEVESNNGLFKCFSRFFYLSIEIIKLALLENEPG